MCVKKEYIAVCDAQRCLSVGTVIISGGNLQVMGFVVETLVIDICYELDHIRQLFVVSEKEAPLRNKIFGILNHRAV